MTETLRDLLISTDSVCSLVAYRYGADLSADIREELIRVSYVARKMYEPDRGSTSVRIVDRGNEWGVNSTWRTGRKVERHIYLQLGDVPSDDDPPIGMFDTPALAKAAVWGHNHLLAVLAEGRAAMDHFQDEQPSEGVVPSDLQ